MDQDLWLRSLFFQGAPLLNSIVNDTAIDSQSSTRKQKIYRFMKNNHDVLFKERPSVLNNLEKSAFSPLPVELFWDCSLVQRRKLFFKNLERGEVLILKVINDSLPENYKLQVLAKHKCCMKLDDLSLVMFLPKIEVELKDDLELNNYDVIRAAVWSCSIHERKLFVTLSNSIIEENPEEVVKLGKISVSELPSFVGDIQIQHSCYKSYYHQTPVYKNPNWANQLYEILGFKKNTLYSFYKEWDGKECPAIESGKYLKRKHDIMLSNTHYNQAVECYQEQDFAKAVVSLNQALAIYPQNKKALVSRGTVYANANNLRKAFCDTEAALKIDPLYEPAQKQMSVLLVAAAKAHIEQNDIAHAKESLSAAISLDEDNEEATKELLKLEKDLERKKEAEQKDADSPSVSSISSESTVKSSTVKSKKKKKKYRKSRDKDEKRKSHHHKSRSRSKSPKKRKTLSSVVTKVKH